MATDPIVNSPKKTVLSTPLEKTFKKKECLSKLLATTATLAFLGSIALVICASLALIPWFTAAVPIAIGLIAIVLSLILLKKTLAKKNEIKKILEQEQKPTTFPLDAPEPVPLLIRPSLEDFSSILSSEDLKKILIPSENDLSIDPTIWFSDQRLEEAFLQEWNLKFGLTNRTMHYQHTRNAHFALVLRAGNISTLHLPSSNKLGAIVNAANTNMSPGGAGTNAALSRAVTKTSWEASKEGKSSLQVSEVSAGTWISTPPFDSAHLEPAYLFQALGPKASEYPDTFKAYSDLISAYVNCFEKAMGLRVNVLQLPLLSSSNFGTPDRGWPNMAKMAFLAGLSLFLEQNPKSSLQRIILVDLDRAPNFNT